MRHIHVTFDALVPTVDKHSNVRAAKHVRSIQTFIARWLSRFSVNVLHTDKTHVTTFRPTREMAEDHEPGEHDKASVGTDIVKEDNRQVK